MNYTELKAFLASELNRQDLAGSIPTFIALAEADMGRKIRHRKMIARSTNVLDETADDSGGGYHLSLPDDFAQAKNVQLNVEPAVTLQYVTLEMADLLRGGNYQVPSQPIYYTIVGDQLEFVPMPDTPYQVELTYYEKLETLSDAVPTTWLLEQHPDVYLYGALLHSAPFLKNDERVPVWDGLYQRAVEAVNFESDRSEVSGATLIARTRTKW